MESSYWWSTGGAGDGASTYTRTDLKIVAEIMGACSSWEGVAPKYLGRLNASAPAANTLRIASGGAIVDGKPYYNSSNLDVNIPSASTPGNTRIDRIVLRADWTGQTVRVTRIAGTEGTNPAAPAIIQTSGTTYDLTLFQVLVDTNGNLTITEERTMGSEPFAVTFVIGDGFTEIGAGVKGDIETPFGGIISQATLLADVSGSIVVDIWKDTYANFPPTSADSICGDNKPTLSGTQAYQNAALLGWTKTFAAGDVLRFNVDSASTVKQATISLRGYKL